MKIIKMKILFTLLLITAAAGCTREAKAQTVDPFTTLDTIVRTVQTYYADTISLGSGQKSVTIHNTTGGVMQVAFNKGSSSSDPKDSVNFYSVPNGNRIRLFQRTNYYMYLKSSVSGSASIVVDYGYGLGVEIDPISSTGALNVTGTLTTSESNPTDTIWANEMGGFFDVRNSYSWKTGDFGDFDTLAANGLDTLSRVISGATNSLSPTVTQMFRLTVVSLDTCALKVSTSSSMGSNTLMFIPAGGSHTFEIADISAITNYYIQRLYAAGDIADYWWGIQYK